MVQQFRLRNYSNLPSLMAMTLIMIVDPLINELGQLSFLQYSVIPSSGNMAETRATRALGPGGWDHVITCLSGDFGLRSLGEGITILMDSMGQFREKNGRLFAG